MTEEIDWEEKREDDPEQLAEDDLDFRQKDDWQKEFEHLYQSIRRDKSTLKRELSHLNQILKDLQAGK